MTRGLRQRLDLISVMMTVVIAGVVGYVGINIMSNTADTAGMGNYNQDTANNTVWQNSTLDLQQGLESFFSQLGTVFVVIVLVVIIGYLMLLRGGR
jgi:TRAP-type C4-dicarboxylate transport system permease small subunit